MSEETAKTSVDQYGRKTWDVKAYAKQAKSKTGQSKVDDSNGDKYKVDNSLQFIQQRDKLLNELVDAVKEHTIISAGISDSSKVSRRELFGFSCPVCDIAFRDTMSLVDHLNSPQHIEKVSGLTDENMAVKRATLDEVKAMIAALIDQKTKQDAPKQDFAERVAKREAFERKRQLAKRERRNKDRQRKRSEKESIDVNEGNDKNNEETASFSAMMGFSSFGSTKK